MTADHAAQYGREIPLKFGTTTIAPNIIWAGSLAPVTPNYESKTAYTYVGGKLNATNQGDK